MFDTSERFITQMKLRELRQQREALRSAYNRLQNGAAEPPSKRFQQLQTELSEVKFANQSLHPVTDNLEMLTVEAEAVGNQSNIVNFWIQQLEREVRIGQQRAEFVYLFGSLLEEWGLRDAPKETEEPDSAAKRRRIAALAEPTNRSGFEPLLSPLLAKVGQLDDKAREQLVDQLYAPVAVNELENILTYLRNNKYHGSSLRSEARSYRQNADIMRELADALTIMVTHLNEWSWPQEGVGTHLIETYTKQRLFLNEDLPTACLLQLVASRLNAAFNSYFNKQRTNRLARLNRLIELDAPDVIIENERRMLNDISGLSWPAVPDIWGNPASDESGGTASNTAEYGSINGQRATIWGKLRDVAQFDSYFSQGSSPRMGTALAFINSEIELARAAFPDRPLHIVKLDLKEFYASIPHEVLRYILTQLNFPERELRFIERFLSVPLRIDGTVQVTRRGIPNNEMLSDFLGELLMLLLEHHILATVPVQIVRLIDDICLITPSAENALKAWQAVSDFCDACGMAINLDKCGSVTINGERPAGLPAEAPDWIMLTLNEHGEWLVNQERFEKFLDYTREQIAAKSTILSCVEYYNGALDHLAHELGISILLGDSHRTSINAALMRFHYGLFGEGQSITAYLTQLIRKRFFAGDQALPIPEAWLYWPITAGGLGLRQAAVLIASYASVEDERTRSSAPVVRTADWLDKNNDWSRFYRYFNILVDRPAAPQNNQIMEALVNDFIKRGSTISSGKQKGLSSYWRWVLYIYGPQILDFFGTFRFLITELVPLQLISQRRIVESDQEGE